MKLTVHPSAGSFLQACQPELEAEEAVNGLMLGLALRLRDDPALAGTRAYLATVEDENGLALAALMSGLNVILYSTRAQAGEALERVARDLAFSDHPAPGVTGPAALAEEFAACWKNITGQAGHVKTNLRIYVLRKVIPPPQPGGFFRMAREDERGLLVDWSIAFQAEALGEADQTAAARAVDLGLLQNRLYVWEDQGKPVSMAASSRPTAHGMTVNLVYTPRTCAAEATPRPAWQRSARKFWIRVNNIARSLPTWPTRPPTASIKKSAISRYATLRKLYSRGDHVGQCP